MATVKMQKDDGTTADVHPDEVENYKLGGFVEVAPAKKTPAKKAVKQDG